MLVVSSNDCTEKQWFPDVYINVHVHILQSSSSSRDVTTSPLLGFGKSRRFEAWQLNTWPRCRQPIFTEKPIFGYACYCWNHTLNLLSPNFLDMARARSQNRIRLSEEEKRKGLSKIGDPHVDEKSTITSLELHLSCLLMGGLSASSVLDSRHSVHLHMVWLITLMRPSRASGSPIKRHPLNALCIESFARSYFSMAFFARAVESSLRLPRYLAEDLQRIWIRSMVDGNPSVCFNFL